MCIVYLNLHPNALCWEGEGGTQQISLVFSVYNTSTILNHVSVLIQLCIFMPCQVAFSEKSKSRQFAEAFQCMKCSRELPLMGALLSLNSFTYGEGEQVGDCGRGGTWCEISC